MNVLRICQEPYSQSDTVFILQSEINRKRNLVSSTADNTFDAGPPTSRLLLQKRCGRQPSLKLGLFCSLDISTAKNPENIQIL